jgi:hypothetical protein
MIFLMYMIFLNHCLVLEIEQIIWSCHSDVATDFDVNIDMLICVTPHAVAT